MKRKLLLLPIASMLLLAIPSCKKCYECTHPSGAAGGYPDRKICGKGILGKTIVEADRSTLTTEGYNCF